MADWANESISKSQTNRLPLKIAWHGFVWDFQTNRLVSFVELWVGKVVRGQLFVSFPTLLYEHHFFYAIFCL